MAKGATVRIVAELGKNIREMLHDKAGRIRTEAYGWQVEAERDGLPPDYIERRSAPSLAWADMLDGLAGVERDR